MLAKIAAEIKRILKVLGVFNVVSKAFLTGSAVPPSAEFFLDGRQGTANISVCRPHSRMEHHSL